MSSEKKVPLPSDYRELLATLKDNDEIRWRDTRGLAGRGKVYGFTEDAILVRYRVSRLMDQWKTVRIPHHRVLWDDLRENPLLEGQGGTWT